MTILHFLVLSSQRVYNVTPLLSSLLLLSSLFIVTISAVITIEQAGMEVDCCMLRHALLMTTHTCWLEGVRQL